MFNFNTVLKNFHNLSACNVIHHIYGILWFSAMLTEAKKGIHSSLSNPVFLETFELKH